ncbi:SDR family NAD(P)-dependent oxidoreductase [Paracoccus yeei]|uniref:SDR family NAD(P)-dependent oxidoreductase n=1 Tax=Paracoccus yeei TaxID=147645 RepID=A0A386UHR3_9RHOB|nr:SDR family NAD(P)-dependent oxidoreductase [Paracoccus yeei]AYF00205.1 SDR family NAD(P)-dependent oxidoreductase [Paracoccus yeei]
MSGLFDLTGRRVLVTGAGGGLGTSLCTVLAGQGADVLTSDRSPVAGPQAAFHAADLSQPGEVAGLAEAARGFGVTDLVLNAGIEGPRGPLAEAGEVETARAFQVNLFASLALVRHLLPVIAGAGGGSVVLMASIAALRGNGAIGIYGLTKAALVQLARTVAVEWGPRGVRANAICPGLIDTPLAQGLKSDVGFMARRMAATPLRRMGRADEIAGTAAWLISPAGGFVTGQAIVVDGGTLITDGS